MKLTKKFFAFTVAASFFTPGAATPKGQRQGVQPPSAAAAPLWETYTYPGEEFSVALPEMPVLHHESRRIKNRRNEYEGVRAFAAYADGVVYTIWSYDKPAGGEDVDHFAQYYRTGEVSRGVKVYGRQQARLGDFPGRRYVIVDERFPGGENEFTFYVYRARAHAYVVAAYGAGEGDAAVRRFFESFTLSDRPTGRPVAEAPAPRFEVRKKESAKTAAAGADRRADEPGPYDPAVAPADYVPTKELTRRAIMVFRPEPQYTEVARRDQVTGNVTLRMALRSDGTVGDIVVISQLRRGLTEMAVQAAGKIKFIPAEKDGRRVTQYVTMQYNFNIY